MKSRSVSSVAALLLALSSAGEASANCSPIEGCANQVRKHAAEFDAACKAGACVGPTGPNIPDKDRVALARGLVLTALYFKVSPKELLDALTDESAKGKAAVAAMAKEGALPVKK